MIIKLPRNFVCETFKREDVALNEQILQIMAETRSKLENLNYKAVIISVIK